MVADFTSSAFSPCVPSKISLQFHSNAGFGPNQFWQLSYGRLTAQIGVAASRMASGVGTVIAAAASTKTLLAVTLGKKSTEWKGGEATNPQEAAPPSPIRRAPLTQSQLTIEPSAKAFPRHSLERAGLGPSQNYLIVV
jgi:hypothetical protein